MINFSVNPEKLFLYYNTNNCHKLKSFGILFTTGGYVATPVTAASLVQVWHGTLVMYT